MFTNALLPDTFRAIKLVSKISDVASAYLAGGTALALHMGHRISVDLDFFTRKKFSETVLSLRLKKSPEFKEEGKSWRTIWGRIGETKFSFFFYEYPLLDEVVTFEGIKVAGKKDLAAMKIHAIEDRGTRRDFVDVFFLAQEFPLDKMLEFYDQKYGKVSDHFYSIMRALTYFEDAEKEAEMPRMLKNVDWNSVKKFFVNESRRLWKLI